MDSSGPVSTAGVPPPAPPPPPASFSAAKVLGTGWRSSANRDNVGSVSTAKPPERSLPFAGVHPETLQHAAQRLRPTQYRESLFPPEREQLLDGSHQLASGRHWTNQPQYDSLAEHQTGTKIHAAPNYSQQPAAVGVNVGYSPSLSPNQQMAAEFTNMQQQQQHNTKTYNNNNNKNNKNNNQNFFLLQQHQKQNFQPSPPPPPQQQQNIIHYKHNYDFRPPPRRLNELVAEESEKSTTTMERRIPIQLVGPLPGQNWGPATERNTISSSSPFSPLSPPPLLLSTKSPPPAAPPLPINATASQQQQQPLLLQQQNKHLHQPPPPQLLLTDPKRYIHEYATKTPVASIYEEKKQNQEQKQNNGAERGKHGTWRMSPKPNFSSSSSSSSAQQQQHQFRPGPLVPDSTAINGEGGPPGGGRYFRGTDNNNGNGKNINFVARELRDQGLTERQRLANQQQKSVLAYRTAEPPVSLQNYSTVYQQRTTTTNTKTNGGNSDPVEEMIREMEKMNNNNGTGTNYGTARNGDFCTKCRQQISGDPPGVTALGQPYHVTCFCCDQCQKQLAGCSFYAVDGKNLCQVDYMNSLEKCGKCKMPITQKILRALGKAFHPECFVCPSCQKSLDGIPFTVDSDNAAYCLECFHERFSPRCAACLKVIAPSGNETEVARVIAMDRSYHLDCYKCEDCGLKLNSKIEGQGCYPLESHLFCKNCNLKRLKMIK